MDYFCVKHNLEHSFWIRPEEEINTAHDAGKHAQNINRKLHKTLGADLYRKGEVHHYFCGNSSRAWFHEDKVCLRGKWLVPLATFTVSNLLSRKCWCTLLPNCCVVKLYFWPSKQQRKAERKRHVSQRSFTHAHLTTWTQLICCFL